MVKYFPSLLSASLFCLRARQRSSAASRLQKPHGERRPGSQKQVTHLGRLGWQADSFGPCCIDGVSCRGASLSPAGVGLDLLAGRGRPEAARLAGYYHLICRNLQYLLGHCAKASVWARALWSHQQPTGRKKEKNEQKRRMAALPAPGGCSAAGHMQDPGERAGGGG